MAAVDELLEGWTSQHPKDEIAQLMLKEGVPCAPVRELSEVIEDENMHARGSLQRIDHPELGRIVVPHSPLRFEGSPPMRSEERRGGQGCGRPCRARWWPYH